MPEAIRYQRVLTRGELRRCNLCEVYKDETEFSRNGKGRLAGQCKDCVNRECAERYRASADKATIPSEYIARRQAARVVEIVPQVETGVPLPIEARGGTRKFDHRLPFENMLVGDSFWVKGGGKNVNSAVTKFAKKSGWKFVTRGQGQDGTANVKLSNKLRGTRVWRTE